MAKVDEMPDDEHVGQEYPAYAAFHLSQLMAAPRGCN